MFPLVFLHIYNIYNIEPRAPSLWLLLLVLLLVLVFLYIELVALTAPPGKSSELVALGVGVGVIYSNCSRW